MTDRSGTCNIACWQAKEATCHCLCGGRNHSIMRGGGSQPQRQTQRQTGVYDLVAIADNWTEAYNAGEETRRERGFPSGWQNPPILLERATERTLKWPEVQAVRAQSTKEYPSIYLAWVKSLPTPTEATPELP